jgi:hypothetical protein
MRVRELQRLKMNPDQREDGTNGIRENEIEQNTVASLECSIVEHLKTVTDPL